MDISMDLLQWLIFFWLKKTSGGTVKNQIMSNKELAENYPNQLLEHLKILKCNHLL